MVTRACEVLGTVLSTLNILSHRILTTVFDSPLSWRRKSRVEYAKSPPPQIKERKEKPVVQDHIVRHGIRIQFLPDSCSKILIGHMTTVLFGRA